MNPEKETPPSPGREFNLADHAESGKITPCEHTIQVSIMPSLPHVCPVSEIPIAAQTITHVLNHNNPFISFLYDNQTPPPLVPYGKPEQLSIYLYRTLTTGLVLTVDDEDQKCVGVAVWQGPTHQSSLLGKLRDFLFHTGFDIWNILDNVFYGGSGINKTVSYALFRG